MRCRIGIGYGPLLGALAALGAAGACHRTFSGAATQPNPLRYPLETLRTSEEIVIVTGDMELEVPRVRRVPGGQVAVNERFPLRNKASFTVVSRDRLRFHVQIEHKWEEYADLRTWSAVLIDDRGTRYAPEQLDFIEDRLVVLMWDYERRTAVRNRFGDIMYVNNDGYKRRNPLGSLALFRGRADLVFYSPDIFTPDIESMTLLLSRSSLTYRFTWRFRDAARSANVAKAR